MTDLDLITDASEPMTLMDGIAIGFTIALLADMLLWAMT